MDTYDAGLLNDYGGGDVGWWQDYLRAELGRAEEFYRNQHDRIVAEKDAEIVRLRGALTALVKTHDRENFMRSADFHREDCRCLRCAFDRARAALKEATATGSGTGMLRGRRGRGD